MKQSIKIIAVFLWSISGMLCSTQLVQAGCATSVATTSKHIVLSEIVPAPESGDEEYIELYNNGKTTIDVAGWKLRDASDKTYAIDPDDVGDTQLKAGHYLVVRYSASHIYLNNSSDSVTLSQADDTDRSTTSYTDAITGTAWAMIDGTWQWTTAITPGQANTASDIGGGDTTMDTTSYQTSDTILLSELLPNPTGDDSTDEWIELVNTGNDDVNISGWEMSDTSKSYTLDDQTLAAGEYLQLPIETTGMSLNNGGETIELTDPFGTVMDNATYTTADEGMTWARFDDEWSWTGHPTPGSANEWAEAGSDTINEDGAGDSGSDDTATIETSSIEAFRALSEDSSGTVTGVVTVQPGILGSQYFYIQDTTAGIQVYSYHKDFPELSVGDTVSVTGVLSSTRGEARIKTSTADDIIVSGTGTVKTQSVTELGEAHEGMLVKTSGIITSSSSTTFEIDGTVHGIIKSTTGLSKDNLIEGESVSVTGIVSQSGDDYRLMPREKDDIQNTSTDSAGTTSKSTTAPLTSLMTVPRATINQSWQWIVLGLLMVLAVIGAWLWHSPAGRAWLKQQLTRFRARSADVTKDASGALFFHPSPTPTTTSNGSIILSGTAAHKEFEDKKAIADLNEPNKSRV